MAQILQPLARPRADLSASAKNDKTDSLRKTVAQLTSRIDSLQNAKHMQQRSSGVGRNGGTKGGGKRRNKGKGRGDPCMPKELAGMSFAESNGEPICFSYNMDGCNLAEAGKRC